MSQLEEEVLPTEDEGLAGLDEATKTFLHVRSIHKGPAGLPLRAWELADKYMGTSVSSSDGELDDEKSRRYIIALHQAAHDVEEQNHEADLL